MSASPRPTGLATVAIAETGHAIVVDHDGDPDCPWVVSIAGGEGPGEEISRFSDRTPAEYLVEDLLCALAVVAREPVRSSR